MNNKTLYRIASFTAVDALIDVHTSLDFMVLKPCQAKGFIDARRLYGHDEIFLDAA